MGLAGRYEIIGGYGSNLHIELASTILISARPEGHAIGVKYGSVPIRGQAGFQPIGIDN